MWLYLLIAALLVVAIAVQLVYLRTYAKQAGTATKVVIYVNIALLLAVVAVVMLFALRMAGS